jgi:pimeloyl-ACP methyl ester carboxylesterase
MTDILLVHGSWHGPWCWTDFARRLSQHGHLVRTIQLRDHDRPAGRLWHRISDYVDDVRHVAAKFSAPPVFVGHSMGGLIVQKYLERRQCAGLVLMAPLPPGGTIPAAARLAIHHPMALLKASLLLRLKPFVTTSSLVREMFFTPDTPQEIVDDCLTHIQDESYLAFLDTMVVRPRPQRIQAPVLVLGAELDSIITVAEVERTARAYRTEAEIFPGMGHDMMLDKNWHKVADRVDAWVRQVTTETHPANQTESSN